MCELREEMDAESASMKVEVKDEGPRLLKRARRVRIILVVVMGCYPYGSTPLVMRRVVFWCVWLASCAQLC